MRVLLVSDIHANRAALDAVLAAAGQYDTVWCLGDVVGYGPEPNECIEILRGLPLAVCLAGNHDWGVLGKMNLSDFNDQATSAILWTRRQLTEEHRAWLEALPATLATPAEKVSLAHASPREPVWEYILNVTIARANFDHFATPICFVGHSHIPVLFRLNPSGKVAIEMLTKDEPLTLGADRVIVNPGSVGQPRDRDPRSAFALFDTDTLAFTHRRVEYDIAATQAKMRTAGLSPKLIARLQVGW
jgi:diadenosine tetraphosphatase ApaH/serine/threonine PP2A family protein phosphatase